MKHLISLCLCASVFNLQAAVPLRWTVETSRAVPAQFEAYQGETLTLEAALQSYGKPLEAPLNYSLYWQTNGMGNAWWSVPCVATASSPSNVLFATWSPTNDVGAKVYNCFIGQPGTIYHAAFQLRLRPSPGATPNELPLPQKVIDFAKVTVLNPPWSGGGGGGVDTNAVREIAREEITPATNQLSQTLIDSTNRLYETLSDSIVAATNGIPEAIGGKLDKTGGTVTTPTENDTWLTLNNSYGLAGSIGTANLYGGSWQRLFLGGVTRGEFEVEEWNDISVGRVTMDPYGWEEEHLGDVLDEKRDLTNNVCTASSGFSAWTCDPPLPDGYFIKEVYHDGVTDCFICKPDGSEVSGPALESDDGLYVEWSGGVAYYHDVTATRRRLATEGRTFVTDDFVTNAVAAARYTPSADDPDFSNAVLAVQIDTNVLAAVAASTDAVAQIGEFYAAFADIGITPTEGGMTLAGLLAALVAAVTWLKRKALTNGKRADGSPEDEKLREFFSESNSLLTGTIDGQTKATASETDTDAIELPDGGVVSASSSAPTITFGTARQTNGLRFCELYITNPDTADDGAIVSISGKVYSDVSLTELPKLEKGATYYFTFAEFKVTQETVEGETVSVSHWKVSKQKLDANGGDIPTQTAA